jgi:C4-dicarboxylate-specific signal transduction histidine kinase
LNTGRIAVEIVVEDSGCGIAPEMLEGIFRDSEAEPTETVRNADGRIGLGLAVVARIVEQWVGPLLSCSSLIQHFKAWWASSSGI